jgi:lipopolysaccharide cholinephosphotransferase
MNLEQEVICGFEVSAKMKRVWAMELDMVKSFVSVCERHNLTYYIMGGTLLGAVRHKGFIPWDNDIDMAMPRKDFNKLLEIGPTAFEKPLFFQTPVTEQGRFFCTYVKIRDERGTAASEAEYSKGINCGMFIDVFCLDEIPDGKWRRDLYVRKLNEIAKMQRFCFDKPVEGGLTANAKHALQRLVYRLVYHSPDATQLFRIYHRNAGKFAGKDCKEVAHLDFGYHKKFVWNRSDWANAVQLDFEGKKLNAPVGFEAILRRQYGDYMRFPDDKSTHDYFEFDPDVPYTEFFKK